MLGCPHYQRRTKLRAPCCGRLFTCRLCHDQVMDHTMDRYRVVEMLCMVCGALQPISGACAHAACPSNSSTATLSRYYCAICHLHDDDASKDIYHCPYCNVCRLGKGLGVDYCHCMKCNACVTVESADTHRCVTHSLESNCPICSTGMFESTQQVKGLRCGHFLHLNCYREYVRHAEEQAHWYRCPICLRSMEDMTEYFGQLDAVVAAQPMPPEYAGRRAKVLCHDCEAFTTVPYHMSGYHKCLACSSYNTRVEEQLAAPAVVSSPDASPDSASGGAPAAS
ncbi:zinc ion binding protein [Tribonema minus]|uniref:Zinc ion binding protein n=1 Tax=Tribonema minus TaxID=303371 RepID=A0A835Z9Z4_9STRA|nr:zinc ion binding protein [Tribonema minus]